MFSLFTVKFISFSFSVRYVPWKKWELFVPRMSEKNQYALECDSAITFPLKMAYSAFNRFVFKIPIALWLRRKWNYSAKLQIFSNCKVSFLNWFTLLYFYKKVVLSNVLLIKCSLISMHNSWTVFFKVMLSAAAFYVITKKKVLSNVIEIICKCKYKK